MTYNYRYPLDMTPLAPLLFAAIFTLQCSSYWDQMTCFTLKGRSVKNWYWAVKPTQYIITEAASKKQRYYLN